MTSEIRHPQTREIEAAFRKVAESVVRRARETGTPIVIWENGEIKRVSPDRWEAVERGGTPTNPNPAE